jgi:hypothetical protein
MLGNTILLLLKMSSSMKNRISQGLEPDLLTVISA